ncbi:MAG: Ca-activated chloride channel family protein [Porticoccaceae bacterium]|jgi:Ca-activated chloride channel family protein|tara:strand:- start:6300 stop:8132 length:1833 start_codon:yes stop_codon:yes gene_type:complete
MFENLIELSNNFHFLRPWWFAGFLPVAAVVAFYSWRKRSAGSWENIINPELLPFLMQGSESKKALSSTWLLSIVILAWIICCLSLAGPTWQQLPQPVYKQDAALVVVLDLSPSMLAEDISPSRLVRARYKLIDVLTRRTEGVAGLIVYGGDAHTVSPLTEDSNTIVSIVPVLAPSLLPEYGSNVEEALASAVDLAVTGGYQQADILLISDGIHRSALSELTPIISQQGDFRLSILGVGTPQGAPIPTGAGGFAKQANGNMVVAKLNVTALQQLAASNGGIYQTLSADDSDVDALLIAMDSIFPDNTRETDRSFDLWDDQGFWLVLLLLPVVLLSFRKGTLVAVLLLPLAFNTQPAQAFEWKDLWKTPNQRAAEALSRGDYETAQDLFEDPMWRGSAAYKAGDFEQATTSFLNNDTAQGHYNRGNALAQDGDLQGAIDAYDRALSLDPDMQDAIANRALVEQLKDQQQDQDQDQDQQNQQSQDQDQEQQDQEQQNQDSSGQDQEQKNQDSQSQDQSQQDKEEKGKPDSEKSEQEKTADEKALEQAEKDAEEAAAEAALDELSDEEKQEQQDIEKMLRRIPDDPGGLLRAKFRYQSRQQNRQRKPPNNQERW